MATGSKVVILTGASRGIGLAAAKCLLQSTTPHRLILCARTSAPLETLQSQHPDHVVVVAGNASEPDTARRCVTSAEQKWGQLDGLIINHGGADPIAKIADSDLEAWTKALNTNVVGAVGLIQATLPLLRKSKGRIIFTSSGAAVKPYPTWGAYGASKAAINLLALTLNVEEPDVTCISVRPGKVDTDLQRALREDYGEAMGADMVKMFADLKAQGQLLRPEQPGNVIARLAVGAGRELGGLFINWDDERLAAFQD